MDRNKLSKDVKIFTESVGNDQIKTSKNIDSKMKVIIHSQSGKGPCRQKHNAREMHAPFS